MKDGNYLIGLLTNNSVSVSGREQKRMGRGGAGLTSFSECVGQPVGERERLFKEKMRGRDCLKKR